MLRVFSRTDRSIFAQWWWSVDRWMVAGVLVLIAFGFLMAFAASPAVAQHIGKPIYHFANKQLVFLSLSLGVFVVVSMLPPERIRHFAWGLFAVSLAALAATLFAGVTIKGASRWLYVFGFSVQPSEILKPAFVVVSAWLLARHGARPDRRGVLWSGAWLALVCVLLVLQPDIGQMTLFLLVWLGLFFLAGGSMRLIAGLGAAALAAGAYLYATMPHVADRVDRFLDPASGDTYQVDKAMDAIRSGGVIGVGLGDGRVKSILPDAHSDYVFAVAAEEGGFLLGGVIIFTFAGLVCRALIRLREEKEHWILLAALGLTCLFGLQAFINLAVNLNVAPTKGMTLPFISYGGSSLIASAMTMGMLVGLMRRRETPRAPAFAEAVR